MRAYKAIPRQQEIRLVELLIRRRSGKSQAPSTQDIIIIICSIMSSVCLAFFRLTRCWASLEEKSFLAQLNSARLLRGTTRHQCTAGKKSHNVSRRRRSQKEGSRVNPLVRSRLRQRTAPKKGYEKPKEKKRIHTLSKQSDRNNVPPKTPILLLYINLQPKSTSCFLQL